jgi:hypothetical protein
LELGLASGAAAAYRIEPDELEDYYRARTTLGVSVEAADLAVAILHFASDARSRKEHRQRAQRRRRGGGVPALAPKRG